MTYNTYNTCYEWCPSFIWFNSLHTLNWANSLVFGPHSHMVVQVVRQVVGYQVFARHADVHRVPVFKLPSQPLKMLFRDVCLGERRCLKEDEVPNLFGHLLWSVREEKREKKVKVRLRDVLGWSKEKSSHKLCEWVVLWCFTSICHFISMQRFDDLWMNIKLWIDFFKPSELQHLSLSACFIYLFYYSYFIDEY